VTGPDEDAVPPDWYDGFFERDWLDVVALEIPVEQTRLQADFLLERLALPPGARILDLACGHGRIAIELARRGFRVSGLDLSPRSLALAVEAAESEGLAIEWIEADMRDVPTGGYDCVLSLYTAFGYFESEEENQRVLDATAAALAPGGQMLIDVVNLLGLAARYRQAFWEERSGGVLLLQSHRFDVLRGRNVARWTFVRPEGVRNELVHSVRTYAPHELAAMLARAGLEVTGSWGGWDGSELEMASHRLILRARKPDEDVGS
jgi:2-polyprenyl-3-methyl-5-hydroxy-6-metoxy-1,4-benzoquinol methylase